MVVQTSIVITTKTQDELAKVTDKMGIFLAYIRAELPGMSVNEKQTVYRRK